MKSKKIGASTSAPKAEISNVSLHGVWLLLGDTEYLLDFVRYPWFRKATIEQIHNVRLDHEFHLSWPDLDIDLDVKSLQTPDAYPLLWNG